MDDMRVQPYTWLQVPQKNIDDEALGVSKVPRSVGGELSRLQKSGDWLTRRSRASSSNLGLFIYHSFTNSDRSHEDRVCNRSQDSTIWMDSLRFVGEGRRGLVPIG